MAMQKFVYCLFLFTLSFYVLEVSSKSQYVMPMSMGMKMSIPYDIANIFIRPIAGTIGVAVSIGLLVILFFGVITSPFGYFFGIPSRKYVLGTTADTFGSPRHFESRHLSQDSFFYWLNPEDLTAECHLLALCHAHNAFQVLPSKVTRFYKIFSAHLVELPTEYRRAIVYGLGDPDLCSSQFNSCPHSGFSLIVKTLLQLLPEKVKNENFRKRKGAMYMNKS